VADLADRLVSEVGGADFRRLAEGLAKCHEGFVSLSKYEEFVDILHQLKGLCCEVYCRKGGGTSGCRIRECCIERGLEGCWRCAEFEHCEVLCRLKPLHGEANIKNLRILAAKGKRAFLEGERYWFDERDTGP
jgi:hypothetical protein